MLRMRMRVKRRKWFLIVMTVIMLVFGSSLGAVNYYGNQAIAAQQADTIAELEKLDKKIAEITARKAAEKKAKEEAERKKREAAEQKAASEAALVQQLEGNVVAPKGCAVSGAHADPNKVDVVINKKRCFNPIDFVPADLVSFDGYIVSAKIRPTLSAMFTAAAAAGKPLALTSTYRSYSNQVTTYNHWVQVNGSYAAADKVSARPGYSEHQTGFVIDIGSGGQTLEGFAATPAYTWMKNNAHKYGFIQRYKPGYESITGYSAEAWHWRYVGKAVATDMKNKGIHTLEQYWGIEGGGY